MSTLVPKVLAQGVMPMSGTSPSGGPVVSKGPATVYTVPATATSYIKNFKIFNSGSGFQYGEIFIFSGYSTNAATRSFARVALSGSWSADLIEQGALTLTGSNAILVQATNSGSVEYLIDGAEEA